jgi:hypothetical protein
MSIQPASASSTAAATTGAPIVNQALEPEWVRHGSAATQKAYAAALSFEQTLVEQLSKSLSETSGLTGESSQEGEPGSGGSDAGASQLSSMLPQSLTASVMDAGGLGMAAQMTSQFEGVQAGAQAQASGGTSAA